MPPSRLKRRFDRLMGRPPVYTLAQMSRIYHDLVAIMDAPHGTVVGIVITELEAAGFLRKEPGYFAGVPAAPRARALNGFEVFRIESKPERDEERHREMEAERLALSHDRLVESRLLDRLAHDGLLGCDVTPESAREHIYGT